mmetsp:Transcript_36722/g.59338  ORF Transcript_36722/g.59338 Transcript_36722/m.59338 type:complete len:122 (-) Transcript_36722:651-1016(-)
MVAPLSVHFFRGAFRSSASEDKSVVIKGGRIDLTQVGDEQGAIEVDISDAWGDVIIAMPKDRYVLLDEGFMGGSIRGLPCGPLYQPSKPASMSTAVRVTGVPFFSSVRIDVDNEVLLYLPS